MNTLPIVGARFRPPAETVLNLLPADTPLILRRQPENPHDTNAIQVLLPWDDVAKIVTEAAEEESATVDNPLHLGYIPRGMAKDLAEKMDAKNGTDIPAKLTFTFEGKPAVTFEEF